MKILIIGGGAAGMMAAVAAAETNPDAELTLLEKNPGLGSKVLISGGGRCNVTTGFHDLRALVERYPRGGKFLQSAFHRFSPQNVMDWFEAHGVPLKTENDGRVFPCSDDGKDIVGALEAELIAHKATVLFRKEAQRIEKNGATFQVHLKSGETLEVDKVILTTGGQAYRHTGSTGEGYSFAETLGHHVTPLAPSLNSFIVQEKWVKELAGVSIKKVQLRVKTSQKYEWTGPIIFTHRGISGPAVFALSSMIVFETYSEKEPLQLVLDFCPDRKLNELENDFAAELKANPKKQFSNVLSHFVPRSLASSLCFALQIKEEKTFAELSKKEFNKIIDLLKNCPIHLIGRAAGDEFVTAGGVDTDEVDPRTMESKLCPGLYFAGELLNIDGFTGGFNLQAAWATGHLAGASAAL